MGNQVLNWSAPGTIWRRSPRATKSRSSSVSRLRPPERDRWEDSLTESLDVERGSSIDLPGDNSPTALSMRLVYEQLDWSATPLGPRDSWPGLLRLVVDLCLDSEFPVQISWGPDLLVLYNDAYIPLLGAEKPPWALGRPAREVGWHLWPASEQQLREVMETGRPYHSGINGSSSTGTAIQKRRTSRSPSA